MQGFLFVDDRDGRVIAEISDPVEAFRLLEEVRQSLSPEQADPFCLVRFDGGQGSLIGTEATTRVRRLT